MFRDLGKGRIEKKYFLVTGLKQFRASAHSNITHEQSVGNL